MPKGRGLSTAGARQAVREIVVKLFGGKPARIEEQSGGLTNHVFAVEYDGAGYVVRLNPDRAKLDSFLKEQWATSRANRAGVPVPEILQVGNDPFPYLIQVKAAGQPAATHPERLPILRALGRYARRINSIRTHGFGGTFDWSQHRLSSNGSWPEFLQNELHLEKALSILKRRRMASDDKIRKIRTILESLENKQPKPVLNHGDLRLKNVLVDDKGRIVAIIDWENCVSNAAPEWEFSIALHDLSIDEKDAFLAGYGITPRRLCSIAPLVKALNLVNYAPVVERLYHKRESAELARYRARLSGALDLYSL
jgi:aminoglycoside phosphotransferase (APT) family kinase protein